MVAATVDLDEVVSYRGAGDWGLGWLHGRSLCGEKGGEREGCLPRAAARCAPARCAVLTPCRFCARAAAVASLQEQASAVEPYPLIPVDFRSVL